MQKPTATPTAAQAALDRAMQAEELAKGLQALGEHDEALADLCAALDDEEHAYHSLAHVLLDAYQQASAGKGKERHANDLPFTEQPMQMIGRRRGIGFILGQADKKSEEAQGMLNRGQHKAFEHEILGAIVYLGGSIVFQQTHMPRPPSLI